MKSIITICFLVLTQLSFSQVQIIYRTVYDEQDQELTNTTFILKLKVDQVTKKTTYSFLKHVKESEFVSNFSVIIDDGQVLFNEGHIGMLYQGIDSEKNNYFIYMMDNYCVIKYLPTGKSSFSDSKTWFTLMDGE